MAGQVLRALDPDVDVSGAGVADGQMAETDVAELKYGTRTDTACDGPQSGAPTPRCMGNSMVGRQPSEPRVIRIGDSWFFRHVVGCKSMGAFH